MISILDVPYSSRGEWRFRLLGTTVRVLPWFWLSVLLFSGGGDLGAVMIWVAVCFVSILVHEMGHVLAFRLYGTRSEAVLYAWGGLAIPDSDLPRGTTADLLIALAGPCAGFCFAAVVIALAAMAGAHFQASLRLFVLPSLNAIIYPPNADDLTHMQGYFYLNHLLNTLLHLNIYWGLVNLLPVYPLDGGRAARAILEKSDPIYGKRRSLRLSALAGVAIAILGLLEHNLYLVFLFGIFAAGSAQLMEDEHPIYKPRPFRDY